MFWVPALLAAASIYSADQQSDAIDEASSRQAGASDQALQFQRNALLSSLTQGYPIYRGQVNALNRLYSMQGLPSIQAAEFNALVDPFKPKANPNAPPTARGVTPEQLNTIRNIAVSGF